ncbi:MAG: DNA-directed RNA polymerase subunit A', partial [Nanoarchaeota archaeon]|nr:DNA-directed RNA polymerase subunit A' [Nanoarchaeota archaeon]
MVEEEVKTEEVEVAEPEKKEEGRAEQEDNFVSKMVNSVVFSVLSAKTIKKMASAKIVTPELYDKEGYPVDGGLMDIRLGVIDPGLKCKTCGCKLKECLGHFGYIELARPIVHVKFVTLVYNILQSTCRDCGRILIPDSKIESAKNELNRIEFETGIEERRKGVKDIIAKVKSVNKCPHCKAKQYKVSLEKPTTFMENDKRINPIEVRARLEKVTDEDLEVFGMNAKFVRPEWMILTVMAIPPVTMRPSITLESGERSEDDLTHKLGDIVRINQRLFENINAGAPEIIIEDLWDLLQYHITTFFDNAIAQLPPARHRSGQPLKTLTERIKSKEGRIRHNLAGKRTNFSARTVISPDPMIKLNEVGVPKEVAMKLTVPERVNDWNMAYLKEFIKKGPGVYPGANYVIRPDGKKKKITEETKEAALEEIQPGYIIERHLMDGDIAIFNRQPSLHRMSMMCHRVIVLPGKTLRLNPAVCHPYNADFDGDEMNLHIPQTEESRAEAEILMEVQTQLISPRYGLSVIGCVQDTISGLYLLTKDLEITREEAIDLLSSTGLQEFSKLPRKSKISGKEVFSVLLPDDFNFTGRAKNCLK